MFKKISKPVAALMAAFMLLCSMPVLSLALDTATSVSFNAFDGAIIMDYQTLAVADGTAEEYGYTVPGVDHNGVGIEGITALDVLVAAHRAYYGESFTAETGTDYLLIDDGQIKLMFGKNATASGFSVNGKMPMDDIYNPLYNSFTGYDITEARMGEGDDLAVFFYQDKVFWSDYLAWFESDELTVGRGSDVTLTLRGYSYVWYGYESDFLSYATELAEVDIYLRSTDGGEYEKIGTTDEKGQITVTLSQGGDYLLCAYGTTTDDYAEDVPVIASYAKITVEKNLFEKIRDFFRMLIEWFGNLFK